MTSAPDRLPGPPMRRYRAGDVDALCELANDWDIARNLRDAFPHPYTRAHAEEWIAKTLTGEFPQSFASASCRVLEKAGYVREGLLRHAAIKEGRPRNMVMYAMTREP